MKTSQPASPLERERHYDTPEFSSMTCGAAPSILVSLVFERLSWAFCSFDRTLWVGGGVGWTR